MWVVPQLLVVICLLSTLSTLSAAKWDHHFVAASDWKKSGDVHHIGSAQSHDLHSVVFAIQQRNLDKVYELVHDISDPDSANYGKFMTNKEVVSLTQNAEAFEAVRSFLINSGYEITKESSNKHFITASAKVEAWEALFATKFHEYSVPHDHMTRKVVRRAESLSLPVDIVHHVSHVFHTIDFPAPTYSALSRHDAPTVARKGLRAQDFSGMVYPEMLSSFYDVRVKSGTMRTSQGIYAALDQKLSLADLKTFQQTFSIPVQTISAQVGNHVVSGPCKANSDECTEANLDVQYIMGIAQNVSTTYYYWTGSDVWLNWITEVGDMTKPPLVFSISYASYETDISSSYMNAFDSEAVKLALQGVSLIAASGDDGIAGWKARGISSRCAYQPMFPACSNYVTAVGGTQGPEKNTVEVACESSTSKGVLITTGGGIAFTRSLQAWQSSHVNAYFASVSGTANAPAAGYSSSGRGLPDVSLLASNYAVVINGSVITVDGTSASAPVFAAMISLVNSKRLQEGLSPMGWLNPSLYKYSDHFARDITSGDNKCTALYQSGGRYVNTCCTRGFNAAAGWDPVTGLGSVDYDRFYNFFALNATTTTTDDDALSNLSSSDNDEKKSVVMTIVVAVVAVAVAGFIVFGFAVTVRSVCCGTAATRYSPAAVAVTHLPHTVPTVATYATPPTAGAIAIAIYEPTRNF